MLLIGEYLEKPVLLCGSMREWGTEVEEGSCE